MAPLALRHQRVQRLRRLLQKRSVRSAEHAFVLEGATLLECALDADAAVESVFIDPAGAGAPGVRPAVERAHARGARVYELAPGVLERVADTVTPQPVLSVVRTPQATLDDLGDATFVVVCVDVRDPGNAGAVMRVADAAGTDGVVCCDGTVDPYNPKTVRASAGSVMHVPVVVGVGAAEALDWSSRLGMRRLGAVAHGGVPHTEVDWTKPCALVLGNEAHGIGGGLGDRLDGLVTIPMAGRAESLNVAMAAAILCFEVRRQRSGEHSGERSEGGLPPDASTLERMQREAEA